MLGECYAGGGVWISTSFGTDKKVRGVLCPGLTELGKSQARVTGEHLRGAQVSKIVSSPLRRAQETAQYIANALGHGVTPDERLQERTDWGGPESNVTIEAFLEEWAEATRERTYGPRIGDSSARAGARFKAALDDLVREESLTPHVVVAHGGVTTDLLRTLFGDDMLHQWNAHLIEHGVPSCAITHVRVTDGAYELISLASLDHLPEH